MADDKKTIGPDVGIPTEAPEQPAPEPALADAEAVMLEHEGQAALLEMGEAVPDPADAVTRAEVEEPAAPEVPKAEKEQVQSPTPGKDDPTPAHSGKVVDFAAARNEAVKDEKKALKQKPPKEKGKATKPGRGRPPKDGKAAPDKTKPSKPRDKMVCTPSSRQRNNLHFTHENPSCIPYGAGCYAASRRSWTSIGVRTPRPRWRRWKL